MSSLLLEPRYEINVLAQERNHCLVIITILYSIILSD